MAGSGYVVADSSKKGQATSLDTSKNLFCTEYYFFMFVSAGTAFDIQPLRGAFGFCKSFLTNGNAFHHLLLEVFSFVEKRTLIFAWDLPY